MGAGTKITKEEYKTIKVPVIAFGLSDPNIYNEEHYENCDMYCTNSLYLYMKLKDKKLCYWYPTSCDKRHHQNLHLSKIVDVLFIGTGNHKFFPFRDNIVNELRKDNIKVKVFGRGWTQHIDTYRFITGKKLIKEINNAKILLDLNDYLGSLGHRIFEGAGCGTPVITIDRPDTRKLFEPDKEILLYNSTMELVFLLKHYLKTPKRLLQIGNNAQIKAYKEHDITVRVNALLKFIKQMRIKK